MRILEVSRSQSRNQEGESCALGGPRAEVSESCRYHPGAYRAAPQMQRWPDGENGLDMRLRRLREAPNPSGPRGTELGLGDRAAPVTAR